MDERTLACWGQTVYNEPRALGLTNDEVARQSYSSLYTVWAPSPVSIQSPLAKAGFGFFDRPVVAVCSAFSYRLHGHSATSEPGARL
jgi:hypothetical protein